MLENLKNRVSGHGIFGFKEEYSRNAGRRNFDSVLIEGASVLAEGHRSAESLVQPCVRETLSCDQRRGHGCTRLSALRWALQTKKLSPYP